MEFVVRIRGGVLLGPRLFHLAEEHRAPVTSWSLEGGLCEELWLSRVLLPTKRYRC